MASLPYCAISTAPMDCKAQSWHGKQTVTRIYGENGCATVARVLMEAIRHGLKRACQTRIFGRICFLISLFRTKSMQHGRFLKMPGWLSSMAIPARMKSKADGCRMCGKLAAARH